MGPALSTAAPPTAAPGDTPSSLSLGAGVVTPDSTGVMVPIDGAPAEGGSQE
jgi:hypothetical protein